jgi:threonine dehydratase
MMPKSYVKKILEARVYDVAIETPLSPALIMSERLGNKVLLKREDLQPVYSFKLRGAYNKMIQLTDEERSRGVVAASAGNHAQGLAMSAKHLGVKAIIVMPKTTPAIKVDAVRARGAEVVLHGDAYDAASAYAMQLVAERGMVYVHPFDDPAVIAGQGTIGMEILRQHQGDIDAVFVPVGGGGLLAGIAAYIRYVRPEVKLIGVEPEDSACLAAAMAADERVILPEVGIFADGVAVAQIGEETFRVIRETVDEVITVSTDEICASIKDIFDDTRSISEPAGALGLAGLKKYCERDNVAGQTLVAIQSGANTNFDRLRYISERAEIGEQREAVLAVTIPEKPGSFEAFCQALGERSVTEFNYRYSDDSSAQVYVGVQVAAGGSDRDLLLAELDTLQYAVVDLTDNEVAKLHVRHMVGGHAPQVGSEMVYSFEFPERPGALMRFLTKLGGSWNITLFHYRNHGAAFGRVLVGLQATTADKPELEQFLQQLGYRYSEESNNEAYRLFMG